VLLFATVAAPEQNFTTELARASRIISQLKQTSVFVILLIGLCGLLQYIGPYDRTVIEGQLREQYGAALYEGGISPSMVPGIASMLANSTITDVALAPFGDTVVVCFLSILGQMVAFSFMHAIICLLCLTSLQDEGLLFGKTVTAFGGLKEVVTS